MQNVSNFAEALIKKWNTEELVNLSTSDEAILKLWSSIQVVKVVQLKKVCRDDKA